MLLLHDKDQQLNKPFASLATIAALAGKGTAMSELQAHHCMTPEE